MPALHRRGGAPVRKRWRKAVAFGAVLAIGFVSTVVLADWLASGTGTGSARARVAQPLETESVSASETLYPGGTGDLVVRVKNPNPYPVTVSSVTQNGTITSDVAGCDDTNHGVSLTDQTGLALAVPRLASETFTLSDAVVMAPTSANECQGATFTIPVSLNGATGGSGGGGEDETAECEDGFENRNGICYPPEPSCDDGIDGTTDTVVDNGDGTYTCVYTYTYFADADGDTYGDPASTTQTEDSVAPDNYVANDGDCDDSDASVNPGAVEVEGDGKDNDCDGVVT